MSTMESAKAQDPFARIALSMSGGGFRATAYHLGTLNFLHVMGLLDGVHMLSTVSGGTIIGAYFAVSGKEGKEFPAFYARIYDLLDSDRVADRALEIYQSRLKARQTGCEKLILAFAEAYDEMLFENRRFGMFWEKKPVAPDDFSLKEIVFNTTEFYSGGNFRFQKSQNSRARIGNGHVNIKKAQAARVRIADIVACSSCFPGGFEPVAFPTDFNWQDLDAPADEIIAELRNEIPGPKPGSRDMAIMDGGIYDNQGLESLLIANERNSRLVDKLAGKSELSEKEQRDLQQQQPSSFFIVSDVSAADLDIYALPDTLDLSNLKIRKRAEKAVSIVRALFTLVLLAAAVLIAEIVLIPGAFIHRITLVVGVVLLLALAFALFRLGAAVGSLQTFAGKKLKHFRDKFGDFVDSFVAASRSMTLSQLANIGVQRITSVMAMTSNIFMKRIRGQGFEELFRNEYWKDKAVASIVGELAEGNVHSGAEAWLDPGGLRATARVAAGMPTSLWFKEEKHRLNPLIACGEFTLCYQLLKYINQYYPEPQRSDEMQTLFGRGRVVWDAFKADPENFRLLPEMKEKLDNGERIR